MTVDPNPILSFFPTSDIGRAISSRKELKLAFLQSQTIILAIKPNYLRSYFISGLFFFLHEHCIMRRTQRKSWKFVAQRYWTHLLIKIDNLYKLGTCPPNSLTKSFSHLPPWWAAHLQKGTKDRPHAFKWIKLIVCSHLNQRKGIIGDGNNNKRKISSAVILLIDNYNGSAHYTVKNYKGRPLLRRTKKSTCSKKFVLK